MKRLFADTGPLLARVLERDQYHKLSLRHWKRVREKKPSLETSNFVLDEWITLLARHVGPHEAAACAREVYESPLFTIHTVDRAIEEEALAKLESASSPKISFTDCTSFAIMHRETIRDAFTFDDDFRIEGFTLFGL